MGSPRSSDHALAVTPGLNAPIMSPPATGSKRGGGDYQASGSDEAKGSSTGGNQLNTLYGVYIPCMLSILGAILFLRLSWAVGQVGFLGVLAIFTIAGSAVFLTALSISAISTNGSMGGGGAYYMISRSLGPEFGGSVGIIFYFANAFGTTFYLVAFADNMVDTFFDDAGLWTKVLIASIALALTLVAAWIGADFFSKLNAVIFTFIFVSITTAVLSLIFGSEFGCTVGSGDNAVGNFTGFNHDVFVENLTPNYSFIRDDATGTISTTERNTFFRVFGIVFPAMTGIMAGANLSGDLKDPGRSIGRGTLYAIFSSILVYLSLAFMVAWTIEGEYLRANTQALQNIACWTAGEYFIVLGIVSSTLSSALGAMTGAARVLQAFCKDFSTYSDGKDSKTGMCVIRILKLFAYGAPGTNEPRYAVLLTWAIAQALLLLGSLDLLASIITNCFLLTYFFTNFACFVLKITGAPNFRPRFRYFSWHTALLGALLNICIMFLASPIFATVSIVLMFGVFGLIVYSAPEVPWGDVSQALIYHQVRKYLLRLDERKSHPKFWRPSILLIVDDAMNSIGLIDFCNNLKKGGLYVIGDVVTGELTTTGSACLELQDSWNRFIPLVNVKAFSEVVIAPTFRHGCQTLMLSAGLGGMRPNTIVIPFLTDTNANTSNVSSDAVVALENIAGIHDAAGCDQRASQVGAEVELHNTETPQQRSGEFIGIIRDALFLNKNLLVARDFHMLDKSLIVTQVKYGGGGGDSKAVIKKADREELFIDIWFTDELDADDILSYSGNLSLMLQLAHGLNRTDIWQECSVLRIVHLLRKIPEDVITQDMLQHHRDRLEALLSESRVVAQMEVLVMEVPDTNSVESLTNEFLRKNTTNTAVLFMNLPMPPTGSDDDEDLNVKYMSSLTTLTDGLPPTVLAFAGQRQTLIATEI